MKRRQLMLLGAACGGLPMAAHTVLAQAPSRLPRIGVLWHAANEEEEAIYLGALRVGLREHGYIEGRNVVLENRYAAEQLDRFASLATELVNLKVDVLLAVSPRAALAAHAATNTIPVVFLFVPDPVGAKLVASFARPGANVTGLSTNLTGDIPAKRLQLLKEGIPAASRIVVLANPANPTIVPYIENARVAARSLGMSIDSLTAATPADIDTVFKGITRERFDALFVPPDALYFNERKRIGELATKARMPVQTYARELVDAGMLMSYGPSFTGMARRAAYYLDRILKGAKPADLPVEAPTRYEMVVNLKVAATIGVKFTQSFMLRADEVIE